MRAEGQQHPPRHLPRFSDDLPARRRPAGRRWDLPSRCATRDGIAEQWHTEHARQRRARVRGLAFAAGAARRTHLRADLSHRPADGLLRRSRRAVLERHGKRLGIPHRSRHRARACCRRTFRAARSAWRRYTGPQGAKGQDYSPGSTTTRRVFTTTRALSPGEGLTIVAMWPKGFIMPAVESPAAADSAGASPGYDDSQAGAVTTARRRRPSSITGCRATTAR